VNSRINPTVGSTQHLRGVLRGRVIAPGDAGYDQARAVFYGGFDRRPAAIARPTDAAEVAQVVALARESGLELAVMQAPGRRIARPRGTGFPDTTVSPRTSKYS